MKVTKSVNRPVFRLAQPGQNVTWTTRNNPQTEAIRLKKQQLAMPSPEPTPDDFEYPESYRREIAPVLNEIREINISGSRSDPYSPENLNVSDDQLAEMMGSAVSDREIEAIDEEMDRRGWSKILDDQRKKIFPR